MRVLWDGRAASSAACPAPSAGCPRRRRRRWCPGHNGLEEVLQANLHSSRLMDPRGHVSKKRARQIKIRCPKEVAVGHVEHFEPKLNPLLRGDPKVSHGG